ncbi:MAG: RHS repeat protein, partial [Nitrospirae bacterium]
MGEAMTKFSRAAILTILFLVAVIPLNVNAECTTTSRGCSPSCDYTTTCVTGSTEGTKLTLYRWDGGISCSDWTCCGFGYNPVETTDTLPPGAKVVGTYTIDDWGCPCWCGLSLHNFSETGVYYVMPENIPPPPDDLGNQCSLSTGVGSSANLKTGNLYHDQTVGGLIFSYNSLDPYKGVLGKGWTHNYNLFIPTQNDGSLALKAEDGNNIIFKSSNGAYYPEPKTGDTTYIIKNTDGTYTRRHKDGKIETYNTSGKIISIRDLNANTTTLTYTGNDLTTITDPNGRTIYLTVNSGRITAITDISGRTYAISYNGDHLSSTTDSEGSAWQ